MNREKSLVVVLMGLSLLAVQNASADKAILAGGCFWCMEADFEALNGVTDVVSGFTGGTLPNPTYEGNHQGHYEAVEITYDASIIDYQGILEHFWMNIDPFDGGGQFCDRGPSYLSAIFVSTPAQRQLAERSKQRVMEMFPDRQVVTPILPTTTFYPIAGEERHHQDYYKNNPLRYKLYRWNCGRDRRLQEIWGAGETH